MKGRRPKNRQTEERRIADAKPGYLGMLMNWLNRHPDQKLDAYRPKVSAKGNKNDYKKEERNEYWRRTQDGVANMLFPPNAFNLWEADRWHKANTADDPIFHPELSDYAKHLKEFEKTNPMSPEDKITGDSSGFKQYHDGGPVHKHPHPPVTELDEVNLGNVRNSPRWKAYKDSLDLYNKTAGFEGYTDDIDENNIFYDSKVMSADYVKKERRRGKPILTFEKGTGIPLTYNEGDTFYGSWPVPEYLPTDKNKPIKYIGMEGSKGIYLDIPLYKKPTKPLDRTISKVNPKGIDSVKPTANNMPNRFFMETVPYNISDKVVHKDNEGNQYVQHKGRLKKKQSRADYRKTHLRPNEKEYNLGGNLGLTTYRDKNINMFGVGGQHEESPYGGIPFGKGALVQQDEASYNFKKGGKFIFSNEIRYD